VAVAEKKKMEVPTTTMKKLASIVAKITNASTEMFLAKF